jgi:hypothetical protein
MRKRCPICDSTEWDYDVVSDLGRFCGGCYWELKRFAKDHGLTRYNLNYGQTMIVSKSAFRECVKGVRTLKSTT